jgi:hypothetical protein
MFAWKQQPSNQTPCRLLDFNLGSRQGQANRLTKQLPLKMSFSAPAPGISAKTEKTFADVI